MQKRRVRSGGAAGSGTAALALALLAPPPAGAERARARRARSSRSTPTRRSSSHLPSVAADANGDFVVVWACDWPPGTDTGSLSIQGQRYASDGSPQGGQFQVNTYTTGDQRNPSVAADADGDFVVVWESYGSYGTDTDYGQRPGPALRFGRIAAGRAVPGQHLHDELPVSMPPWRRMRTGTSSWCGRATARPGRTRRLRASRASATTRADRRRAPSSRSTPTRQSTRIVPPSRRTPTGTSSWCGRATARPGRTRAATASRASATPRADRRRAREFQVNTYTTSFQTHASVAADADGDFVVVWESYGSSGTDTSGFSIQGQRYASGGSPQGAEFQVNSYTTSDQQYPSVAAAADGDFVVVWNSAGSSGTDTSGDSIQGQRYACGRIDAGRAVPGQHLHDQPAIFRLPGGDRRRLHRGVAKRVPRGKLQRLEHLWPALRRGRRACRRCRPRPRFALGAALLLLGAAYGAAGGRPGVIASQQYPRRLASLAGEAHFSATRDEECGRVRREAVGVRYAGAGGSGWPWPAMALCPPGLPGGCTGARARGRGVPGQHLHDALPRILPPSRSDANGDFVVVWCLRRGLSGTDTGSLSIQGQRYASDGSAQGAQFQVNT